DTILRRNWAPRPLTTLVISFQGHLGQTRTAISRFGLQPFSRRAPPSAPGEEFASRSEARYVSGRHSFGRRSRSHEFAFREAISAGRRSCAVIRSTAGPAAALSVEPGRTGAGR